ncbi:glycosyltransferase [Phyllobacterium salinisoli]|uniref:Glycosyltransferase n=1 Tax=Phyllobacterium salinisoli TaxID=1899321 RepID=A0A368K6V3_9HYPH|nr:glycosyltransferase [Phyllobacterium salinisoli]RCS25107.1 glycosyltransferase [Phyllobacterium salinisoli]
MRFIFYTHSLVSDWNHGNAHFLRGVMRELLARGHKAVALEPENGWSRVNMMRDQGAVALDRFSREFPELTSFTYGPTFPHEEVLAGADVVVVHEWTDPALVRRIGRIRADGAAFTLLFHDTHHRAASATTEIADLDLDDYDGVLAFGETLRERYLRAGWGRQVFTWHEAADTRLFKPRREAGQDGDVARDAPRDVVWVGNWGDGERTAEIEAFLTGPVRRLGLNGTVHGVRYPEDARARLAAAGLDYRGWIANADVPEVFARHRLTVHIPRRPYTEALPGIPTIRMFEALACGIPLISAPWADSEGLFREGRDFLFARDGEEMGSLMRDVIADRDLAAALSAAGLETIRSRHTCAHRVDELFTVLDRLGTPKTRGKIADTLSALLLQEELK